MKKYAYYAIKKYNMYTQVLICMYGLAYTYAGITHTHAGITHNQAGITHTHAGITFPPRYINYSRLSLLHEEM